MTHGPKLFYFTFWCRTIYVPFLLGVDTFCAAFCPLCCWERCGLSVVGKWVGFFKVDGRSIKQDLIPHVGQLELANVPIEGWIIAFDAYDHQYGPCDVLHLPINYGEAVHTDVMICDIGMTIDGGGPEVFPEPFPKGPCIFPYVLLITIQLVTLLPVYYSTFLCDVMLSLSLGATRGSLMLLPFLKLTYTPTLPQMFLKLLFNPLVYGTTMYMLLCFWLLLLTLLWLLLMLLLFWAWVMLCLWLLLIWILFKAKIAYLHLNRVLLMCSSSSCTSLHWHKHSWPYVSEC